MSRTDYPRSGRPSFKDDAATIKEVENCPIRPKYSGVSSVAEWSNLGTHSWRCRIEVLKLIVSLKTRHVDRSMHGKSYKNKVQSPERLDGSISLFHVTGERFKPQAGQGRLSPSVGCIYAKGVNDYENSSRHMSAGRPSIIKEKKRRRLPRLVKLNQTQTVVQLIAQYNAVPSASASEHTVQ
ncbi:uncharacterized protein TNCV_2504971 [Trichonephila clavipes]|uniref:Uncharacterized protein n=1 Tax=Trichonephila clavipes TaxID=2585209 RepID=A0A8X6WFZ4_TRICX|nr:uncharacterized protein TNCV_2504971 [Trichonephila clavipes]